MVCCCVPGCTNKPHVDKNITFHRFPKNENLRKKWLVAINRPSWSPTMRSVVCSEHFKKEDMDRSSRLKVQLREEVVPSLFSHHLKSITKVDSDENKLNSESSDIQKSTPVIENSFSLANTQSSSQQLPVITVPSDNVVFNPDTNMFYLVVNTDTQQTSSNDEDKMSMTLSTTEKLKTISDDPITVGEDSMDEFTDDIDFSSSCRVCAKHSDHLVPIFEGKGLMNELAKMISQYLPFEVSEDDILPKNICNQCAMTIISWHDAVSYFVEANKKLNNLVNSHINNQDENEGKDNRESSRSMELDDSDDTSIQPVETDTDKSCPATQMVSARKRGRKEASPMRDLQEYKLHYPLKYHKLGGISYLRTKVLGFEPGEEAEMYTCCICNENMKDSTVIEHSKSHYPLRITDCCQECNISFGSIILLRNHIKKHVVYIDEEYVKPVSPPPPLVEYIENYVIEADPSLVQQEVCDDKIDQTTHSKEEVKVEDCEKEQSVTFICERCGLIYTNRKAFRQHFRRAHCSPFSCQNCPRGFASKSSLDRHKCIKVVKSGKKKEWFECKCRKIFIFEDQYTQHRKNCVKAKKELCTECKRWFPNRAKLELHVLRQHLQLNVGDVSKNSTWMCEICGCQLGAISARKHYLTHVFSEKKYTCKTCSMKFRDKASLARHTKYHSNLRPYTCNLCPATFKRPDHKRLHLKNKHNIGDDIKTEFECRVCNKHFTSKFYLMRHQRLHSSGISYECQVCKTRFPTEHSLKMHQTRTKHDRDATDVKTGSMTSADWINKFRCNVCYQRYGSINSLKQHSLVHLKSTESNKNTDNDQKEDVIHEDNTVAEQIYECPKCKLRYLSELGLKLHLSRSKHYPVQLKNKKKRSKLRTSTSQKIKNPRFKCLECNEMFGTLLSLKMHKIKRKHFSKCPYCDKRFALEFKLKYHLMKVHQRKDITEDESDFTVAEIMPFECGICLQKFSMEHNLQTHISRKHAKQPTDENETVPAVFYEILEEQNSQEQLPIIYHCTDCWENFANEDDFRNHKHEKDSYVVAEEEAKEVIVTEIVESANDEQDNTILSEVVITDINE